MCGDVVGGCMRRQPVKITSGILEEKPEKEELEEETVTDENERWVIIPVRVPESLRKQFKSLVWEQELTMQEILFSCIQDFVDSKRS